MEFLLETERAQNHGCKICGQPESKPWRLSLDHNHDHCPGKRSCGLCVRSLLCDAHNRMIALAGEDIEILQAAIDYLVYWKERHANLPDPP